MAGNGGTGMAPRRRAVLAAPALLLGAAAPGPGVRFRIRREGAEIGTHSVTLESGPGGGRVARSAVDIEVRLAGFVVYRYRHRLAETWAEGRLRAIASQLERNGRASALEGRAEGDAFLLTGPDGTRRLPAETAPLTWWDPAIFRRPLFDARSGRLLSLATERTPMPDGGFRYSVSGDAEGVATYDPAGRWSAHAMRGEDGSAVSYERIG